MTVALLQDNVIGFSSVVWIMLLSGGGTIAVGWLAIRAPKRTAELTSAKLEGSFGTRLEAVEGDITEIKGEQIRQWKSIVDNGEKLSRLEGRAQSKATHG